LRSCARRGSPDPAASPHRIDLDKSLFLVSSDKRFDCSGFVGNKLMSDFSKGKHARKIQNWSVRNGKESKKCWQALLRSLAKGNTPTRVIGLKLGRSEDSVRSKAHSEGVSLKPTNRPPYGNKE
jgi:hypothetical protein